MSGRRTPTARSPTSRSTTRDPDPSISFERYQRPLRFSGAGVLLFAPLRGAKSRLTMAASKGDPMTALHDLSAVELLKRYRAKTLSPSEVFADVEAHIKALYAYDPETARAEAAASTTRWAKGSAVGSLDGVPVTVKENIASKGVPVPLGTAAMPLNPAAQ